MRAEAGIDAAGQRQHRREHAEHQHQQERPDEVGHGEKQAVDRVDQRANGGVANQRREDRDRAAEQHRENERREGELQRRRQPLGEQLEHVAMQRDRRAEIATAKVARPDEELCQQARVEPVMGAQRRNVGGRGARRNHHGDRVAGHDAQQDEDDDRDADHRDRGHAEAANDGGDHGTDRGRADRR